MPCTRRARQQTNPPTLQAQFFAIRSSDPKLHASQLAYRGGALNQLLEVAPVRKGNVESMHQEDGIDRDTGIA